MSVMLTSKEQIKERIREKVLEELPPFPENVKSRELPTWLILTAAIAFGVSFLALLFLMVYQGMN